MSERLEIFLVGNAWIIGRRGPGSCSVAAPAQVVAMPIPTGAGLSMGWVVLPLPIDELEVPGGLDAVIRGVADETMVQQYSDQLAEVQRRKSPLTLPRGMRH